LIISTADLIKRHPVTVTIIYIVTSHDFVRHKVRKTIKYILQS